MQVLHKEQDANVTQGTECKCYTSNRMQMLHKEKDAKATQGTGFKCYVGNRMQVLHREQVASTVNIIKMLHNE